MNHRIFTFTFAFFLIFVSHLAAYEAPKLEQPGGWTLCVISDPQAYQRYGRNQGIFTLQTAWIAENIERLNIQQVLCVGDLVESNNLLEVGDGRYANQTGTEMWESVSHAFSYLDGKIPYILTTGNHDYGKAILPDGNHYGTRSSENRETQIAKYFPLDRNPAWKNVMTEVFENAEGMKTVENAAYEFTAPNGQKILTIALEFAPRPETLAWAKTLCGSEKYRNHFVILLTHSYMRPVTVGNTRDEQEKYGLNRSGGRSGEAIWKELVFCTPNIRMVICGHHSTADKMDGCCGFRVDENCDGKPCYQMLFDVQAIGGGWEGNGGDGWLRLLEFSADMSHVKVRTFSTLFAISPSTQNLAWDRSENAEFEFDIQK